MVLIRLPLPQRAWWCERDLVVLFVVVVVLFVVHSAASKKKSALFFVACVCVQKVSSPKQNEYKKCVVCVHLVCGESTPKKLLLCVFFSLSSSSRGQSFALFLFFYFFDFASFYKCFLAVLTPFWQKKTNIKRNRASFSCIIIIRLRKKKKTSSSSKFLRPLNWPNFEEDVWEQ